MKMDRISVGDEVRFATSPDVVEVAAGPSAVSYPDEHNGPYHPDYVRTKTPRERKLRMRVALNKQGLLELNLSARDLRDIPSEAFNFTRLEVLLLSKNRLTSLTNSISRLHRLKVLDIRKNIVVSLPETLINCVHLQELDVSHNQLTVLPKYMNALRNLRILKMNHNQFDNLPSEIGDLESLRILEVHHNRLWHLPTSFQNLNNVRQLNLGSNAFDQFPITVCYMKNLEALDFRSNRLITLPKEFDKLKYIKEINLSHNKMETVPYSIPGLKALHSLDLSSNKLKSLPARLARCSRLKLLIASNNQITNLPNNLESLEFLNVDQNFIRNFSVSRMKRLRHLSVNYNGLENLPLGVMNLQNLEVMKLSHNQISYVSQDIGLMKRLRTLDLSHNNLTSLPSVINELENLESFNVKGNRIAHRVGHEEHRERPPPKKGLSGILARDKRHHTDEELLTEEEEWYGRSRSRSPRRRRHTRKHQKATTSLKRKKALAKATQYEPHSRVTQATQYTPKSTYVRDRPPLDYQAKSATLPHFFNGVNGHANGKVHQTDHQNVHQNGINGYSNGHGVDTYTETWVTERNRNVSSLRSNAATINDTAGDDQSLGEEDFDFQPTTVRDLRLLGVASEVETMLNKQLIDPLQPGESTSANTHHRGIFKKGVNAYGTLKTLKGLVNSIPSTEGNEYFSNWTMAPQGEPLDPLMSPSGTLRMSENIFMRKPVPSSSSLFIRTNADVFKVTPAGGLFKSTTDPNITIYFPVKAIDDNITILMQIEKIDHYVLDEMKKKSQLSDNIISLGDIVHITQMRNLHFNEQITMTIPAPPTAKRGKLHILTYMEDNTVSPSTTPYKYYQGYITIQSWHFSGKGAVLTKSHSRQKASRSVEYLMQECLV